jgi:HPt (histidine-containing phosphotransfer) domain-containing protein
MMPEMDGYVASRKIREFEVQRAPGFNRKQPIHIVAMTANAMQGDHEKCLAAGMNDYVAKPVQIVELRRALQQWKAPEDGSPEENVSHDATKKANEAAVAVAVTCTGTNGSVETADLDLPVDLERLGEVTLNKPERIIRFVSMYLKQSEEILRDLHQAIQNGAAPEVRQLAHKLAGSSGSIGMVSIVAPLKQLERMGEVGQLESAPETCANASKQFERIRAFLNAQFPALNGEAVIR